MAVFLRKSWLNEIFSDLKKDHSRRIQEFTGKQFEEQESLANLKSKLVVKTRLSVAELKSVKILLCIKSTKNP